MLCEESLADPMVFMDARDLADADALHADLCIVGAGAAGIAMAMQFAGTPVRIALIEGGGMSGDDTARGIYTVANRPTPRLEIDPLLTWHFGGNTNHWFGNCRPLDDADFEPREWIPHSGWPIRRQHLLPFYERAQRLCGLGDFRAYDVNAYPPHLGQQPGEVDPATLTHKTVQTCRVLSFAELYRPRLQEADNVRICLNARALRLQANARGDTVCALEAGTAAGRRFRVSARAFVLAAGGIENARLLLCSDDGHPNGLGNAHDLVGRFFMEHPFIDIAIGHSRRARDPVFQHQRARVGGTTMWAQLALTDALMRRERLTGLSLWPAPPAVPSAGPTTGAGESPPRPALLAELLTRVQNLHGNPAAVAARLWRSVARRARADMPGAGYFLRVAFEQAPDPRNRVQLSSERDGFGQPTAELVYRFRDEDIRRYARSLTIAAQALGLDGQQLVEQMHRRFRDGQVYFFWHHMGTTRMHPDPRRGVVDGDCRVHGLSNLFVAGSSVFPTGGTAAPTLTIVALALRLAEHIRRHYA